MPNDINQPQLMGNIDKDTQIFCQFIKELERLLNDLPVRYQCNPEEKKRKDEIYAVGQKVRSQFMNQHRETIYSLLTDNFSQYQRLDTLAFQAAECFPGLVPTAAQMREEKKRIQMDKEGFEIDQGIFFRGLLDSHKIGNHLFDAMLHPCSRALALKDQMQTITQIDLGTVLYERREKAAFLTINNPKSLNAENNQFVYDMETAVDLALLDENVEVCVIRGGIMSHPRYEGKRVFCSGINLKDLSSGNISFVDFLLTRELGYLNKIVHGLLIDPDNPIRSLRNIQKPWIAAVDSFAIGGGMQLLLVCDKVIAAEDSYFSLPAAQEGIIPGVANYRLTQMSYNRLARQIILSGRKINAISPQAQYFCDEVVPSGEMNKTIEVSIEAFSNPAVIANRRMLNFTEESRTSFLKYMSEFAYIQAIRLYSTDVLAKVTRFTDKSNKTKEETSC